MTRFSTTLACLSLTLMASSLEADIITLKSGQKIEGQVLKAQSDVLYVDVGVAVVRVPVAEIQNRIESNPQEKPATKETSEGLLRTAKLASRTVKELVTTFAEGVVLVQTPGGLGSGFIVSPEGH